MTKLESHAAAFDLWARVYDAERNPLLMLEERIATELLPNIRGANVLDVGCGTGRWLHCLEALQPASLTGIDCSAAMLNHARQKCVSPVRLIQSDASSLPVDKSSQDLILCSFALSYIHDLPAFARECARALKPGGDILISDMHPVTAQERGWTRSFRVEGESIRLKTHTHSLDEIVSILTDASFKFCTTLEPCFALPEQAVFEHAGILADFHSLADIPAIYLLKMKKIDTGLLVKNTTWSAAPTTWHSSTLAIEDGLLTSPESGEAIQTALDLSGYVLLPGLINAHDHLEFALFPNLGRSSDIPPYTNASQWAEEIHYTHAAIIAQHRQVPLETRLWWGAIRNLLCGVTTVCHHNPVYSGFALPDFPVRVVSDFGWSHSLAFDECVVERFNATPADQPFILHAAEGTDKQSRNELAALKDIGVLNHRTVLVHGLALTPHDISLLNHRGASLILCPTSNNFLFHQSPPNTLIQSVHRAALGSDSPLTAAGDLLDEVHYLYSQQHLDAQTLYTLVTTNPADILHLQHGEGRIQCGHRADLIAVQDAGLNPAETLAKLSFAHIELAIVGGRVQLASPEIYARLPQLHRNGLYLLEVAGRQRWIRADLPSLFQSAEEVLGPGNIRLGGKEVRHLPTL